ncbi:DUF1206 domain-containing protein [Streptomyces sp. NPDC048441]|uniref:DUF1206 domain-containing protein n=1 Tax=Streptomyces sp. NPDC048441 TaxID=3365552 RepID=UPI0037182DB6
MASTRVRASGWSKKAAVRRSAEHESLTVAGRAGFVARGVVYVLIGALPLRIALGGSGEQATGRARWRLLGLRTVATTVTAALPCPEA